MKTPNKIINKWNMLLPWWTKFIFLLNVLMEDYRSKYLKYKKKYLDVKKIYDFIIVGGGSAGAVIAARLSEMDGVEILLVEAGPNFKPNEFPDELTDVDSIGSPNYDWGYESVEGYIGHAISMPRARVIGGCSAHNACAATRATVGNFSKWSEYVKNWTFEDVLPYYKKMENCNFGSDIFHGRDGPFPIRLHNSTEIISKSFIDSVMMLGYEYIEDLNNGKYLGVGHTPMNVIDGKRQNTAMVYLTAEVRKKITIIALAEVDKVIIEGDIATSVILFNGSVYLAKHEIIISAGTFGSCEILKRSGIGPTKELKHMGIKLLIDAPVGQTLYDQPFYYNVYKLKDTVNLGEGFNESALLYWTKDAKELDIFLVAFPDDEERTLTLGIGLMQPKSCGSYTNGRIDLNYFRENDDMRRMVEAIKLARKITSMGPLGELILHEIYPGDKVKTDDALEKAIVDGIDSFGHPTSTVPMGEVVDEFCMVHGMKNLRVVDASVFPYPVSCPPNVTVIMVAEKISDHIKKNLTI